MVDPIVAHELVKVYGGKVRAVDGVSFEVHEGEMYGFLGPNGAGKTTTVQMLTGNLRITSGRAEVAGLDVARESHEVKRRIGLVFQEGTADPDLTGRENLELAAALFGVPLRSTRSTIDSLLERMQIGDAADRLVKTYSGGMRRRLELGVGIIHSPSVLFLDEPTLGLDPQGRAGFWRYVLELRKDHGMSVFVTTHYLDEADTYCDRIAIIDHGKIVATGTPSELKDRLGGDIVTARLTTPPGPAVETLLRGLPGVTAVTLQGDAYRVKVPSGEQLIPALVAACEKAGVGVAGVSLKRPSLDEVFLEFTGREYREEEGPTATDRAVRIGQVQQAFGRARR
ncbi:MAG TPA: ATP-binding cassette domain-containing protein [Thermoplasmata archaeon]|nr:ATP-binding cassette domain-containing protein [Thermoplasmata archaeon]